MFELFRKSRKLKKLGMCFFAEGFSSDGSSDGAGFGAGAGTDNGAGQATSNFEIPAEYAQSDWAKNFEGKTGDDLKAEVFKTLDSQYSNAPVIPQDAKGYEFNEILKDANGDIPYTYSDEALNIFGGTMKDLGLTKEQGQGLLKTFTDFELSTWSKYTDADECEKNLTELFGNNSAERQTCQAGIKKYLSPQEVELVEKTFTNDAVRIMYKLAKGFVSDYGVKEGTQASNKQGYGSMMSQADKDAEADKIYKALDELKNRPHTDEDKQALIDKLISLNK